MRKIDGVFHIEGEQIIKTSNGQTVPDDEPLFLIRARDSLAVVTLQFYRAQAQEDGCNYYLLGGVATAIDEFLRFAREHPERMKQPGVTRGK